LPLLCWCDDRLIVAVLESFDNHTHFSILDEEHIQRDEYAEVEHINAVLHGHLYGKQNKQRFRIRCEMIMFQKQHLNQEKVN